MESTMGRPPIGKIAMTSAERVRRHRLKQRPEHVAKPVTKHSTVDVEALQARIRELEQLEDRGWEAARRGIKFTSEEYRLIIAILHPDATADPALKMKHERAFKAFTGQLPEAIFREKKKPPGPNKPPPMPRTAAEWTAAKQRTAERKRTEAKARKTARKLARP
jgi:hypothetical protein